MTMPTNEWTTSDGFQWVSRLLSYPGEDWAHTVAELNAALPQDSQPMTAGIRRFLEAMAGFDVEQRQDHYVQVFDFGKKTNLYLTYADFGEERERGPALLEFKKQYAQAGFDLNENELPDFLPAVLEFCAQVDAETARRMLLSHAGRLARLQEALAQFESPYAHLLQAAQEGVELMQTESKLVESKPELQEVAA
jgi:nitrate reductase delta subunit